MSVAEVDVKEELHRLVDQLPAEEALEALDYLRWVLVDEEETLSEEEWVQVREAEEAMARGEYVTLKELKRSLAT